MRAETENHRSAIRMFLFGSVATGVCLPTMAAALDDAAPVTPEASQSPDVVIVTAQKREERLQDVPAAVSALSAASLTSDNKSRLRDYFDTVPGFQVSPTPGGGNQQNLSIRGISSGFGSNPTVGIMIDDVPFGATTYDFSPEVDPSDLQRVEVLRGPQGTLYGANSMGGLVKYVTQDPSTTLLSGRTEAGLDNIAHGDSVGYAFRGSVNIPLSSTFAIRASAFTRAEPGYIDNPVLNETHVNKEFASGAHVSALWKATDDLSIKLGALYQYSKDDGSSEEVHAAGLGDYQQNYIPNTGQSARTIQAYSAVIHDTLGPVDLMSVTAYTRFRTKSVQDYTTIPPWGGLSRTFFGVPGAPTFFHAGVNRTTQEIRATFKTGEWVDWLVGGFYSDETTPIHQVISAENVTTGAILGNTITFDIPFAFREYALFVDPTLHLTDRLSIQFGGRSSWINNVADPVPEGGAIFPTPVVYPAIVTKPHVFTYLVTPEFKINSDVLVYTRIATGYRAGRANSFNPDPNVPRAAGADKTYNYEIGIKGDIVPHLLKFDTSIYYIDWKEIQLNLVNAANGLAYFANAGRAKSEGAELSFTLTPGAGLTLSSWLNYDNAVLTQGVVNSATYAPAGQRLPFSARYSANVSADEAFPISGNLTGSVGATFGYTGKRYGTFIATSARDVFPAYNKLDLRGDVSYGTWNLNLYVKNVTDSHGELGGGAGSYPPTAFSYIQPRTIGASVSKKF